MLRPVFQNIVTDLRINAKNIVGWRTKRKIIVFAVDDFGNVRLDSKEARERMDIAGLSTPGHFDAFDSLENRDDLEMLFDTLSSVKDSNGKPAVFTAFSVPCNINFEKMASEDYREYHYELLPLTYEKLSEYYPLSYKGTWQLWLKGISDGLIFPQFHGREHLNLKIFEEKLQKRDYELITALKNRSYTSISQLGYPTISPTAAFEFWNFDENFKFKSIIEDGLNAFEKVFGFRALHFNPPGGREHHCIHKYLKQNGILYLDTSIIKKEHQGLGKYRTVFNYTGGRNSQDMIYNVRNVIFEPLQNRNYDWVDFTLKQIEAAFRWNKPAVISSHRANFCGHISQNNRYTGLKSLKHLLTEIVTRWPDAEFQNSVSLMEFIKEE